MDGRRRQAVDRAVGIDGACTAAIPAQRRRSPRLQVALFATFILIMFALDFAPSNIVVPAYFVLLAAAIVVGRVSVEHFLIGAIPDGLVVVGLKGFRQQPTGVVKELSLPVDIHLESKFALYKITIDGVIYDAAGRTYPEWLEMIEKTGTTTSPQGPRPVRFPPRTLDTATRIAVPVLVVLMYTVLIVTNPPWMETIDRAWFVDPATAMAMLGWLASGVAVAVGWKEGLLVGIGATAFGLLAMWGDTLHGYVSFGTPFYATQVAAIVVYGAALAVLYRRASKGGVALAES